MTSHNVVQHSSESFIMMSLLTSRKGAKNVLVAVLDNR